MSVPLARVLFPVGLAIGIFTVAIGVFRPSVGAKQPGDLLTDGQAIFRFDTFGDEQLWTDTLQLHSVVASLSPVTLLGVGIKVDAAALPPDFLVTHDLNAPSTTVELLNLNAVVGIVAEVKGTRVKRSASHAHSAIRRSIIPCPSVSGSGSMAGRMSTSIRARLSRWHRR
jgi:hypothetical protein